MSNCRSNPGRYWAVLLIVPTLAAAGWFTSTGASAKEPLGRNWEARQFVSINKVDHAPFDDLLKKHVDRDGYVNYAAWHKSIADRKALRDYLDHLSQASPSLPASHEAKLAFWINAYNAVTLEGILQVYPTDSIRNHTAKLAGYNIWKDLPLQVGGKSYSLDSIEHQLLRKMGEPRIHFAIVCASVGCPRLKNQAYMPDEIDEQLAENTRDFFSRSQNLQVVQGGLRLSSIVDWFGDDFGGNQAARLKTLKPYFPESAQGAAENPRIRVEFLDYDWTLNDQARKPASAARGQSR